MSLRIQLKIDTIHDLPMNGFVSNDDGYKLRDMLCEAIIRYEGEDKRKEIERRFYAFQGCEYGSCDEEGTQLVEIYNESGKVIGIKPMCDDHANEINNKEEEE